MNKVILIGRLAADPILRTTTSTNRPVASFSVACKGGFSSTQDTTTFINCVAWTQNAVFLSNCHKGDLISVEGYINNRSYVNKEGKNVRVTEVVASSVTILNRNGTSSHPRSSQEETMGQKVEAPDLVQDNSLDLSDSTNNAEQQTFPSSATPTQENDLDWLNK